MDKLEKLTIEPLLGIATAIIGGVAGAIISTLNSRYKIQELKITHEQQLRERYLKNARDYSESLYIPLAIAAMRLREAYLSFQKSPEIEINIFREEISEFIKITESLFSRGASAFLTNELDSQLISFKTFLSSSLNTKEEQVKAVFAFRFNFQPVLRWHGKRTFRFSGKSALHWKRSFKYQDIFLSTFTWQPEVLAAPLNTKLFGESFVRNVDTINRLIKEVTLGSKSSQAYI